MIGVYEMLTPSFNPKRKRRFDRLTAQFRINCVYQSLEIGTDGGQKKLENGPLNKFSPAVSVRCGDVGPYIQPRTERKLPRPRGIVRRVFLDPSFLHLPTMPHQYAKGCSQPLSLEEEAPCRTVREDLQSHRPEHGKR